VLDGRSRGTRAFGVPIPGASEPRATRDPREPREGRHDDRIKAVVLKIGLPDRFAKQDELRERIAQLRTRASRVAYTEWLERTALYWAAPATVSSSSHGLHFPARVAAGGPS